MNKYLNLIVTIFIIFIGYLIMYPLYYSDKYIIAILGLVLNLIIIIYLSLLFMKKMNNKILNYSIVIGLILGIITAIEFILELYIPKSMFMPTNGEIIIYLAYTLITPLIFSAIIGYVFFLKTNKYKSYTLGIGLSIFILSYIYHQFDIFVLGTYLRGLLGLILSYYSVIFFSGYILDKKENTYVSDYFIMILLTFYLFFFFTVSFIEVTYGYGLIYIPLFGIPLLILLGINSYRIFKKIKK